MERPPGTARLAHALWGISVEAAAWGALVPATALSRRRAVPLRQELGERLGRLVPGAGAGGSDGPRPWLLHAVSAGEMVAATALVAELAARGGPSVVLTCATAAGRRIATLAAERFPGVVRGVGYLPWDRPRAVAAWLGRLAPGLVVTVEAELWPSLFSAARDARVPLAVVSGRLSEGEARRYRLVRPVFRHVLSAAAWIGAQTPLDAARFADAGADPSRVEVAGNLKWDAPLAAAALPPAWQGALGGDLVVAASTHAPEEEVLLDALVLARPLLPGARLALAPRDAARAPAVAALCSRKGLRPVLMSSVPPPGWDVLVVDGYGSLPALYAAARAAFVGGSLAPRGGHSPIEPALAGLPILMGPSDASVLEPSRALEAAGALRRLDPGDPVRSAAAALGTLLGGGGAAEEAAAAARLVAARSRGVAARTLAHLVSLPRR